MPVLYNQAKGVDGIKQTLYAMQQLTNQAITNELIRAQAAHAVASCSPGDTICQQASLMIWVQRKMQFVKDPLGVEALHDPKAIALAIHHGKQPWGDCDDFSMYLAALMKSIGIPASFRAVGFNGGPLSHVYVVGRKGAKLDPTRNMWNPGVGELLPETSYLEVKV